VRDLVQLLEQKGYRGHYTFEVFNDDYVNSDPMVIGQRGMKSARWISESVIGA
jgi:predicted xylose isomerase-like sugar epimerase